MITVSVLCVVCCAPESPVFLSLTAPAVERQSHASASRSSHAANYSVLNPDTFFQRPVSPSNYRPSPVIKRSHDEGGGGGAVSALVGLLFTESQKREGRREPLLIRPNFPDCRQAGRPGWELVVRRTDLLQNVDRLLDLCRPPSACKFWRSGDCILSGVVALRCAVS